MASGFVPLTQDALKTSQGISELNRMLTLLFDLSAGDGTTRRIYSGFGSPLNVVVADKGSLYMRYDGGANTSFYVKEANNGLSTGWVAK